MLRLVYPLIKKRLYRFLYEVVCAYSQERRSDEAYIIFVAIFIWLTNCLVWRVYLRSPWVTVITW